MATETANRGYLLPDPDNKLNIDVLRLIAAFELIDVEVAALILNLASKAPASHTHGISAITGLVDALANKIDISHHDALSDLTDVEVAGVANGMVLLRQASKWIPALLQIGNVNGLETALNGKATAADITAAINTLISSTGLKDAMAAAFPRYDAAQGVALTQAQRGRFASNAGQAWEQIGGKISTSMNQAQILYTGLSHMAVRMRGLFKAINDGVNISVQVSTDNAASWFSGSPGFTQQGLICAGSGVTGIPATTSLAIPLNRIYEVGNANPFSFALEIDGLTTSVVKKYTLASSWINPALSVESDVRASGRILTTAPINAIRILTDLGNFDIQEFVLEGARA